MKYLNNNTDTRANSSNSLYNTKTQRDGKMNK